MYYLKYYAEIQNFRGQFSRVEIHQAGTRPGQVLIIGDVCGLDLEIQGSQDDVFTPIVKTQAHLSMISSDDKPTEGGVKYGGWGEFFTPDATLYKMLIKTRATEQDPWTTRWTGYITPDSWQEDLGYRTPVTITARDNIGHLQDFEFDYDNYDQYGLASIRSIIAYGIAKIEFPMTLDTSSAPASFQADGTSILDAMVVCSHFEGKDWYTVIEALLDAIGYTLRFTDNNQFTLAPIRYLPKCGRQNGGDRANAVNVEFYDGNGAVVPAVKSIIEEHNYDYMGEVELPIRSNDIEYSQESTYKAYVKWTNTRPGMEGKVSPINTIVDPGSTCWLAGSEVYKPTHVSELTEWVEGDSWDDYIFLAANGQNWTDSSGKRKQSLQFRTRTPNVTLRAKFNSSPLSVLTDIEGPDAELLKGAFPLENIGLNVFEFKVKFEAGGYTLWWNDQAGWVEDEVTNTRTFETSSLTTDVEIQLAVATGLESDGLMTFYFENIRYETCGVSTLIVACRGVYARLSSFTVEPNAINLSKNRVQTNSNDRYNVTLKRNPEISPLSRDVLFVLPANYETGLFYYPTGSNFPEVYPYEGNWSNLNTTAKKPLPVIIHQQILAFRGGVLWELSGECAPADGSMLFVNDLVRYKNRVYLITSGTIDFLGSGNLSGAALREYLDYDDIWDDTEEGDWSGDGEYNTVGGETASGSGHSGSSSGNGGSSNNFFELDGNGGVKLKDRYNGLSATGFITAGGGGSTSEEGGADLASVWVSLRTNEDDFANEKIHPGHLPPLSWSMITSGKPDTLGGYGITDAYTKTQVDNLIGAIDQFHYEIYPSLASITSPAGNVLYLIGPTGTGSDKYEEYVYANSTFTKIGDTTIDLSPYLTIASAQATYQPIISDLATIRSRSDEGHTAYGWGDHSQAGYLLATTAAETYQTIINDLSTIRSRADEGHTAYGWGNHANAGYFAASSFTAANIVSTLGTTAVNRATADANGNNIASTYATVTALNNVSNRVSTLEGRTNWDNYFGIDASGNIYVKMKDANTARNFYGYGAVTAGGVGSSSGGGGGEGASLLAVWRSLTNNNSLVDADITSTLKIATAHIPDLSISKVTGLQTALDGKQATISDLSTIRSNASLGASAYNALPNYLPLSGGNMTGTLRTLVLVVREATAGDGYSYIDFENNDASVSYGLLKAYNTGLLEWNHSAHVKSELKIGTSGSADLSFERGGANFVNIASSGSLEFYMRGLSRTVFCLASNGNIGIGKNNPSTTLDVAGGVFASSATFKRNTGSCLILDTDSADVNGQYMSVCINGYRKAEFGWLASLGAYMEVIDSSGTHTLNLKGDGTFQYDSNNILHAGNYSSYALPLSGGTMNNTNLVTNMNADLLDGLNASDFFRDRGLYLGNADNHNLGNGYGYGDDNWRTYGAALTFGTDSNCVQLQGYYYDEGLFVRTLRGNNGTFTDWREIYHSGNSNLSTVSWACSTLTAYSGTILLGNDGGYIDRSGSQIVLYDGSARCLIYNSGNSNNYTTDWTANTGYAKSFSLRNPSDTSQEKMNVSFSGTNVVCSITGGLVFGPSNALVRLNAGDRWIDIDGHHSAGGAGIISRSGYGLYIGASENHTDGIFINTRNNVGIGTTSPSQKLHVVGTTLIENHLMIGSASSADLTFNRASYDNYVNIANGGSLVFYNYGINNPSLKIFADGTILGYYGGRFGGKSGVWIGATYAGSSSGFDCIERAVSGGTLYIQYYHNGGVDMCHGGGAFTVGGATTLSGALTVNNTASISGNTTIGGTLNVTGSAYLDSTVRIGGSSGATLTYESAYGGLRSDKGIYSLNYMTAGGVNASSDQRQKSDIVSVSGEDAVAVLMALRPSEWVWNEKHYLCGQKGAGLIAQEVQGVLPFAVSHDTKYLALNYNVFHAYEIKGFQNHEDRIKALERESRKKDEKIASLSTECRELRRQIAQLTS